MLKNAEGIEIGTRTLNNDELKRIGQTIEEGNYSNLTDLVSAKEAEVYLHFLESGSTAGMIEAELRAVQKIEELIQSNKIDYNGILRIRNKTVKSDVEVVRKTTEDSVEDVGRPAMDENVIEIKKQVRKIIELLEQRIILEPNRPILKTLYDRYMKAEEIISSNEDISKIMISGGCRAYLDAFSDYMNPLLGEMDKAEKMLSNLKK